MSDSSAPPVLRGGCWPAGGAGIPGSRLDTACLEDRGVEVLVLKMPGELRARVLAVPRRRHRSDGNEERCTRSSQPL